MNKQLVTYPFTPAGVAQWRQSMAAASQAQRNTEADLVEQGLYDYVPDRFTLEPEQVAFFDNLPPALCNLWAAQISYAIREQIPIELVKPELASASNGGEGTKFIESEATTRSDGGQAAYAMVTDSEKCLRFTIGY